MKNKLQPYIFLYGIHDDYATKDLNKLCKYFISKIIDRKNILSKLDNVKSSINEGKFILNLPCDITFINNLKNKAIKLLKNKPFKYSKIKNTQIEQVGIFIVDEKGGFLELFSWEKIS